MKNILIGLLVLGSFTAMANSSYKVVECIGYSGVVVDGVKTPLKVNVYGNKDYFCNKAGDAIVSIKREILFMETAFTSKINTIDNQEVVKSSTPTSEGEIYSTTIKYSLTSPEGTFIQEVTGPDGDTYEYANIELACNHPSYEIDCN